MIHQEECHRKKERASEVEPRSCQRNHKENQHKKEEKEKKTQPRREKETRTREAKHNQETTSKRGQASRKPLFDAAIGGSDAESRVGQKLTGVPPWETQRECINELTGSNLVELEKLGKHP